MVGNNFNDSYIVFFTFKTHMFITETVTKTNKVARIRIASRKINFRN